MKEYWNCFDVIVEIFKNGWLYIGDLVMMDVDGFVMIVDRKKDMIIFGGENIYLVEVENVIFGYLKVVDVGVIGCDS